MTTANQSVAIVRRGSYRRSQILGTQVISQTYATRLGIVGQVWVDLTERQVVALGILGVRQPNEPGASVIIDLTQAKAIGPDAILIDEDTLLEEYNPQLEGLFKVVGSDVVTETGVRLGKVKDFIFEIGSGFVSELVLSNLGIPLLPGFIDSTYRLSTDEVIEVGSRRLITVEGSENRCLIEVKSFLQRANIGKAPWDQERQPIAALPPASGRSALEEDEFEGAYRQDYDAYEETYEEDYDTFEPEPEPIPRPRRSPSRPRRAVPPTPKVRPTARNSDDLDLSDLDLREDLPEPQDLNPQEAPIKPSQVPIKPPLTPLEFPEDAWADDDQDS